MPRAMWKGSVTFGLVNIPIRMFTAVTDKTVRFHRMSEDGSCRLRTKLFCPETGEEYDFGKTARGFEVAPDQYVILTDEEIEALQPEAGHAIEIEDFVSLDEIDPVYYERPYYLAPAEGGGRPYRLLVEAMTRARKVGIARFVLREKQHLAALRVSQGGLCLSTMHYADEVHALTDVTSLPEDPIDERQVSLAVDLIGALTRPFEPTRYKDGMREQVLDLIERKAHGERIAARPEPERRAEVVDLMDALKKSLGVAKEREADEKPAPKESHRSKKSRKSA
jgi:DNA end-binding protein Ku